MTDWLTVSLVALSVVDELAGGASGGVKSPGAADKTDGVLEDSLRREAEVNKQLEEENR